MTSPGVFIDEFTCSLPATSITPIVTLRILSGGWSAGKHQHLALNHCLSCPSQATSTAGSNVLSPPMPMTWYVGAIPATSLLYTTLTSHDNCIPLSPGLGDVLIPMIILSIVINQHMVPSKLHRSHIHQLHEAVLLLL
jgi:hypothetical protein